MRTRVQRWGNSLAVRIPKTFAEEVGLRDDSPVDLRLSQGRLVLEPSSPRPPSLDKLLGWVSKANIYGEIAPGPYNANVGLAILCPITSRVKGYPFEVPIPDGLPVEGAILSDQAKSLDWKARKAGVLRRTP